MPKEIRFFRMDRRLYPWLSNFYESWFVAFGMKWTTVEHCYQAMKTLRPEERQMIQRCETPAEAKRKGSFVLLRPDWDTLKDAIMLTALSAKFANKDLAEKLTATGDAVLIEDNPHDAYWGIGDGTGQNKLGKFLMQVREELRGTVHAKAM